MYSQIRKSLIVCIVCIASGSFFQTANANTEANKAVIAERWLEMANTADLSIADEIYADYFTSHIPNYPQVVDLESYKREVAGSAAIIPDFQTTLEDIFAEEDKVVGRFTATGKMPPVGAPYTNTWIILFRFEDGKIAEEWWQFDLLGVQEQLGAIPPTRENYTWGEPSNVTGDPGDPSTNKTIVERSEEIWNTGDAVNADEVFAADFVNHDPALTDVADLESLKGFVVLTHTAFPDFHVEVEDMVAEGDRVAIRRTVTATHRTDFMGIPATGRKIQWTGMTVYRIADGKIVESWWSYDALGMMWQLTTPEWPIDGSWITCLATPMGNMLVKGIWAAQDAEKTRFTGEFEHLSMFPLLMDLYPDADDVKFAGALAVKTGVNQYEMTALEYFISRVGPCHEEIVGIGVVNGILTMAGPDQTQGQGTGAYYIAAQDTDQDGFPDEGQTPALCVPWQWSSKCLTMTPGCVPTTTPESSQ